MSKSESICRYAYTIFIQLCVRQLGSLYVAIHASSDWKTGGGITRNGVANGAFSRQCVGDEDYLLDSIMHKWSNPHFDDFEKKSRCNMKYGIKRINTN